MQDNSRSRVMKSHHVAIGLLAAGLLSAPLGASANTLPAAFGGENVAGLTQATFGTLTYYQVPGGSATALPGLATANNGGTGAEVFANSYYYFEVTGPATGGPSTAIVDLVGTTATTSGGGLGEAEDFVGSAQLFSYSCAGDGCGATPPPLVSSITVELNNPVEISVHALVEAGPATALADPYITIDPLSADAAALSVEVSDGVSNVPPSPVPLPAPALLLLSGLGGLVCIARARRRTIARR